MNNNQLNEDIKNTAKHLYDINTYGCSMRDTETLSQVRCGSELIMYAISEYGSTANRCQYSHEGSVYEVGRRCARDLKGIRDEINEWLKCLEEYEND